MLAEQMAKMSPVVVIWSNFGTKIWLTVLSNYRYQADVYEVSK